MTVGVEAPFVTTQLHPFASALILTVMRLGAPEGIAITDTSLMVQDCVSPTP
jgi:hypothetical protein